MVKFKTFIFNSNLDFLKEESLNCLKNNNLLDDIAANDKERLLTFDQLKVRGNRWHVLITQMIILTHIDITYRRFHQPVNAQAKNIFSLGVKRLRYRFQTLKFSRPNVKLCYWKGVCFQ